MKLKIKPYIFYLLKENFFYIISLFFILIILFIVLFMGTKKIIKNYIEIKNLENDLLDLKNQIVIFNYDNEKEKKISESIEILNMLIPNFEDYFSIIYSLEKLSNKNGLIISDYSIDSFSPSKEKIKLFVTAKGDITSFFNFLKEYNFSGGRLITLDSFEYEIDKVGTIKFNLNFYNKNFKNYSKVDKNLILENNIDNILSDIDKIKNKLNFDHIDEVKDNFDYFKKSNPFQ